MTRTDIQRSLALRISTITILTAITTVFTLAVRIPVAPTRGYINLGDVAIYFSAFAFGPFTAFITGGLGTALADVLGGFAQWAPITLLAHGFQGFVVGLIVGMAVPKKGNLEEVDRVDFLAGNFNWKLITKLIFAFIGGTVVMAGGYLLAESFIVGFGAALVELPGNVLQNVAGIVGGVPLTIALKKAYPPIENLKW